MDNPAEMGTSEILRMRNVGTVNCEGGPGRKECTLYTSNRERTIEVDEMKITGEVISQVDWTGDPEWHGSTPNPKDSKMECVVAETDVEMGVMDPRRHRDGGSTHRVLNCDQ